MKRVVVPALFALLAACSQQGSEPHAVDIASASAAAGSSEAATEAASSVAMASDAASSTAPAGVSRYTKLTDCKVVREGDGEDWSESRCEGVGGYGLTLNYGDARDDLEIARPGQAPANVGLHYHTGGGFSTLAETVEWRGHNKGGRFTPAVLIVRNMVDVDPEHSVRQIGILNVIDLEKACVVALVRPKVGQNEDAQAIADGPRRPCLKS